MGLSLRGWAVLTKRFETMKLALYLAALLCMAGYIGLIPQLSGLANTPVPLIVGGIITFGLIYTLAKLEP
jgi:hypothetical protein